MDLTQQGIALCTLLTFLIGLIAVLDYQLVKQKPVWAKIKKELPAQNGKYLIKQKHPTSNETWTQTANFENGEWVTPYPKLVIEWLTNTPDL